MTATAVAPTIQRHENFKEAGMLTPSIIFCLPALLRSDRNFISVLLLTSTDQKAPDELMAKSIDHLMSEISVVISTPEEL